MSRPQAHGAPPLRGLLVTASVVAATFLACSDSTGPLNVENPANANVASLELRPSNLSVGEGRTQKLTVIARDADGTAIPSAVISWQSTDPGVAAVDAKGTVEGLGRGTATITAQAGAAKAEVSVRVRAPLSSISVAMPRGRLQIGESVKLNTTLVTTEGDTVSSSEVPISWSTSDESVLEVDDDGTVRGKGRGLGRVKAESEGKKGSRSVRVSSDTEEGEPLVTVDPAHSVMYALEDELQLTAELSDSTGNTVEDASFTWESLDTKVASVTGAGKVISRGVGTVLIAVSSQGAADTAVVEVEQVVAALELSPETASVDVGKTVQFSATATDSNGFSISSPDLTWSSSDPAIATVSQNGLARGEEAGEAVIRASADGTTISATGSLTVQGSSSPPPSPGTLPAFPGAEGWGATALERCREMPLVVHKVTNTNDSGAGSFRDIIENRVRADRFDVVIFTTGGLIQLNTRIREHRRHCVYIAGQSAPGGGISVVGNPIEFRRSDDLVVRHIRHRGHAATGFRSRGGHRVIYDHVTVSWAGAASSGGAYNVALQGDCSLSTPYPLDGATIQNSLIYEPDAQHPTSLGLTAGPKTDPCGKRISAHRNVLMGPGHRLPMCSALEVSIINNVIYNWGSRSTESNNTASCEWIANYHKPGPATGNAYNRMPFVVGDNCGGSGTGDCSYSFYVAENLNHANDYGRAAGDPWEGSTREVACRDVTSDTSQGGGWCSHNGAVAPQHVRRSVPFDTPAVPAKRTMTESFVEEILARAGHSARLACDGSWVPARDEADQRRIDWFRSGGGPSSAVDVSTIKVPVPATGTPCTDTDGDGLPDEYELRYSGSSTGLSATSMGPSGYLVLELYLAGLPPDWLR